VEFEHHAGLIVPVLLLLGFRPIQGHMLNECLTPGELAGALAVLANGMGDTFDFVVSSRGYQYRSELSLDIGNSGRLPVRLTDFLSP
jgi:hypothetical protein